MRERAPFTLGLIVTALMWPATVCFGSTNLRQVVVVSDLHMGLGRDEAGDWRPTEDFRWPEALRGFLAKISEEGGNKVDLVIAGDFLELWQRLTPCSGGKAPGLNGSCTIGEMVQLVEQIVAAHGRELGDLGRFAATGENCVIVVPGNHDSTLTIDVVWEPVLRALAAPGGCIRREEDGLWTSANGRLLIEHGHQIGRDANKYDAWPSITRRVDGIDYVVQPWGESFVQNIFNGEEARYPLIDNLSPSSAGVRLRMADRGFTGTATDVTRFLRFNLADTSLRQKRQLLGQPASEERRWDRGRARAHGYRLFLEALPAEDPFAAAVRSGTDSWAEIRRELDALAAQLPDTEIDALCDQLAIRKAPITCESTTLGALTEKALYSRREVLREHLQTRRTSETSISTFIYGHTHTFETPWQVRVRAPGQMPARLSVANSGAFQRLVDDDLLLRLATREGLTPQAFLKERTPESLPACYTSVHVGWRGDQVLLETRAWLMRESEAVGRFVDPCGGECPNIGHGCGD